jgi:hypothetical protein
MFQRAYQRQPETYLYNSWSRGEARCLLWVGILYGIQGSCKFIGWVQSLQDGFCGFYRESTNGNSCRDSQSDLEEQATAARCTLRSDIFVLIFMIEYWRCSLFEIFMIEYWRCSLLEMLRGFARLEEVQSDSCLEPDDQIFSHRWTGFVGTLLMVIGWRMVLLSSAFGDHLYVLPDFVSVDDKLLGRLCLKGSLWSRACYPWNFLLAQFGQRWLNSCEWWCVIGSSLSLWPGSGFLHFRL